MTDEPTPTPTEAPAPTETPVAHCLAHLEEELLAEWEVIKTDAKAVLDWIASKV